MENIVVGQLAELVFKNEGNNADWQYCVIEHIFDDRIQLLREDGFRYMYVLDSNEDEESIIDNQPTKSNLSFLYKNGKPVMAKKKLFGGYVPKPKK